MQGSDDFNCMSVSDLPIDVSFCGQMGNYTKFSYRYAIYEELVGWMNELCIKSYIFVRMFVRMYVKWYMIYNFWYPSWSHGTKA